MARRRARRPANPDPVDQQPTIEIRNQPDPAQQARQSAAFEALRSDQDQLAAQFPNDAPEIIQRVAAGRSAGCLQLAVAAADVVV